MVVVYSKPCKHGDDCHYYKQNKCTFIHSPKKTQALITKIKLLIDGTFYQHAVHEQKPPNESCLLPIERFVGEVEHVYGGKVTTLIFFQGTDSAILNDFHKYLMISLPGIASVKLRGKKRQTGSCADGSTATIETEEAVDGDINLSIHEDLGHDITVVVTGDGDMLPGLEKKPAGTTVYVCGSRGKINHSLYPYVKPGQNTGEGYFLDDLLIAAYTGTATVSSISYVPRRAKVTTPSKVTEDDPKAKWYRRAVCLKEAGIKTTDIIRRGYTVKELLLEAKFQKEDFLQDSFVVAAEHFKSSGYTAEDLVFDLGFSVHQTIAIGYSAEDFKGCEFSARELFNAGVSWQSLRKAGFTASELKADGFSASKLKEAGISIEELKEAGFSASELRADRVSIEELVAGGFSVKKLKAAGFSASELIVAGVPGKKLKEKYSVTDLENAKKELSKIVTPPTALVSDGSFDTAMEVDADIVGATLIGATGLTTWLCQLLGW